MRVLGIDPGTRHLGWGVLEREGTRIIHLAHGVIHASDKASLADRLVIIDEALMGIIAEHRPEAGAVEGLFFAKDAQAAVKLGHARGVVLLRLARANLPIFEYAPTRVKRAVVGTGTASKEQVAMLMRSILKLPDLAAGDAADALANAFAHLAMSQFSEALARSSEGVGKGLPQPYKPKRARGRSKGWP